MAWLAAEWLGMIGCGICGGERQVKVRYSSVRYGLALYG